MIKQSNKIYRSTINRIAVAMFINQFALAVLGSVKSVLEEIMMLFFLGNDLFDAILMILDCIIYTVSFVLPVIIFNSMSKNAEREEYLPKDRGDRLPALYRFFAIGIGLGAILLAAYANNFIIGIFPNYSDFTDEFFWSVELTKPHQIIIYFINVAIVPAFVEELLFRRVVCGSLEKYGKITAIIISASLFALMHTNIEQLFYTFVAGLVLGWIFVETKSLLFPILLHFLNNGVSALGDIVRQNCSTVVINAYNFYSEFIIWVFMAISLVAFLFKILKRGKILNKEVLEPNEDGIVPERLSVSERVRGFFTFPMTAFVVFSVVTMALFILLSEFLV